MRALELYSLRVLLREKYVAPVAQLDRALPSGGRGREFESRRVRHLLAKITLLYQFFRLYF